MNMFPQKHWECYIMSLVVRLCCTKIFHMWRPRTSSKQTAPRTVINTYRNPHRGNQRFGVRISLIDLITVAVAIFFESNWWNLYLLWLKQHRWQCIAYFERSPRRIQDFFIFHAIPYHLSYFLIEIVHLNYNVQLNKQYKFK